jgi:DNA-binding transcriptional LysR family regulator
VSQQLAILEREAGVPLLAPAGRGVRLTDAALVLVEHSEAMLDRAALAEADLAAAQGTVAGRGRIAAFQSVMLNIAIPAVKTLAGDAPRLRCEVVESEPEDALPALALGDVDVALCDEWQHQPRTLPAGVERHDLLEDPVQLMLPARHPVLKRHRHAVPIAELADEIWASGHPSMGWEQMTKRACRQLGGFDPDIRHRANDANVSLGLVSRGLAVSLLPALPLPRKHPGIAVRPIAEGTIDRAIFAATRTTDAKRPSTRAILAAIRAQTDGLPPLEAGG